MSRCAGVVATFASESARAGRLPGSAGLLLIVEVDDDADLATVTDRFEHAHRAGYDGVVIDWLADARPIDDAVIAIARSRDHFDGPSRR